MIDEGPWHGSRIHWEGLIPTPRFTRRQMTASQREPTDRLIVLLPGPGVSIKPGLLVGDWPSSKSIPSAGRSLISSSYNVGMVLVESNYQVRTYPVVILSRGFVFCNTSLPISQSQVWGTLFRNNPTLGPSPTSQQAASAQMKPHVLFPL